MYFSQFTVKKVDELEQYLHTSSKHGLENERIQSLQEKYGLNKIEEEEIAWWKILLRQFKSSFIYLLLAAGVISLLLVDVVDFLMILAFIMISSILGFYQEYKSERAVKLLRQYILARAKVIRSAKEVIVPSYELVPGDLVVLEAGDKVPADIRFTRTQNLLVDESIITGESVPQVKEEAPEKIENDQVYKSRNIGFSGTTIIEGEGEGVVIATGRKTVIGDLAKLTSEIAKESGFEKNIVKLSKFILILVVATLLLVFSVQVISKKEDQNIPRFAMFAIALAVSVVPEALPIVLTFSLSRGALKLAENKVVVKRLSSIEDLGGIEVLCADKTGTLTENQLDVSEIYPQQERKALFYAGLAVAGKLASKFRPIDPFDLAILNALSDKEKRRLKQYARLSEIPFDPERKRNSVLVKEKTGGCQLIVRGAPEVVVKNCQDLEPSEKDEINNWAQVEGAQGKRVIALGVKRTTSIDNYKINFEEQGLSLVGLISFNDRLKLSSFQAVKKAKDLGVVIKILTGDSKDVAYYVARKLGLVTSFSEVVTGEELEKLGNLRQHEIIEKCVVFARVSPREKYKIVSILQEKKQVGFLGEGINDAPGLKAASVALVVQGASDIAREAADIVLLNRNLNVIIDGISLGREVFSNTIKYIKVTLSSNFGNFYAIAIASLFINYLPMLPLQILLLNLLSDFPMISVAADAVDPEELESAQKYDFKEIAFLAIILGVVSTFFDFVIFGFFSRLGEKALQTNWFIASILTELVIIYSIRTRFYFLKAKRPAIMLIFLTTLASLFTIILPFTYFGQSVFKFIKPTAEQITIVIGIVASYFIMSEGVKLAYYKFYGRPSCGKLNKDAGV